MLLLNEKKLAIVFLWLVIINVIKSYLVHRSERSTWRKFDITAKDRSTLRKFDIAAVDDTMVKLSTTRAPR